MPNKKYVVTLTDDEQEQLKDLVNTGKTAAYRIKHANVLLKADANGDSWSDEQIAEEHRFAMQLVEAEVPVVAPLNIDGKSLFHYQEVP